MMTLVKCLQDKPDFAASELATLPSVVELEAASALTVAHGDPSSINLKVGCLQLLRAARHWLSQQAGQLSCGWLPSQQLL